MPALRLSFLGPVTVSLGADQPITFPMKSILALLIYLAESDPRYPVPRERLAELLWPGMPTEYGRKNLRQSLYELNKLIFKDGKPPLIIATRQTLQWNPETQVEIDTHLFEKAIQSPNLKNLNQAVTLYRGNFLADFYLPDSADFEAWVQSRREHYRNRYRETLHTLISLDKANAETHARSLVETEPLDEEAGRTLMRILAEKDARTEGLKFFENLRRDLKEQLGVDPDPRTINLYEQISSGKIESVSPPTKGIPELPSAHVPLNLPGTTTPFIGRRQEVEQVKVLIQHPDHRLITLLGPGGTGKTRLSIQAASELDGVFPDGIFFVSLSPVQSADGFLPALAKSLDFAFYPGQETNRRQTLNFLRDKRLLLIIDNFEHLLDTADLVVEILTTATSMKLVVTTRVRLNVPGEQLYLVGGMDIPEAIEVEQWNDPGFDVKSFGAVQLFLERARRVQPGFVLTKDNTPSVMEICRLVHGMPLGLELAAAWIELLQPAEIAAEIVRSLDFLETNQAGVSDRQNSLRAVFESSWKLLSEAEREVFLRLCVFVGSFSRDAAQEVCGGSLRTLLGLANKSWLQQTEGGRFQLHELMRQYGEERLKADGTMWQETKERHIEFFANYVSEQAERLKGVEQRTGLDEMAAEFETNIRTVWDCLVGEQRWKEIIDQMLTGIFHFARVSVRYYELLPWFQEARSAFISSHDREKNLYYAILCTVELDVEETYGLTDEERLERLLKIWEMVRQYDLAEVMGLYFVMLAGMVWKRNLDPEVEVLLDRAVDRLRAETDLWELGWALIVQGNIWSEFSFDTDKLLEAEKIFVRLGPPFERGFIAHFLGEAAMRQRKPMVEIEKYVEQERELYHLLGYSLFFPESNMVGYYLKHGETQRGFGIFHEEIRLHERRGNLLQLADSLHYEALNAIRYSTRNHALAVQQRSLEVFRKIGTKDTQSAIAFGIYELGEIYRVFGGKEKATEYFESARIEFERLNLHIGLGYYHRSQGDIAVKESRFEDALEFYKKFNAFNAQENHLWSIAQAHGKLALAHAHLGNIKEARSEIKISLEKIRDWAEFDLELIALLSEPVCLIKEKKMEQAVELAVFIANHPASWNETRWQAQEIFEWAAQDLPEETVHVAIEQGKALELEAVVSRFLER